MSLSKIRVSGLAVILMTVPLAAHITQDHTDTRGFIYGRVVTESGSEYEGFLRWGTQEAFWDDLFNSEKVDLPYIDYLDDDEYDRLNRRNRRRISIFGLHINVEGDFLSDRQFVARFGDIERIEPLGSGEAIVYMKNGSEYDVSGGADDVTNRVHVIDASLGEIDIRWNRIELIEFFEAPRGATPPAWRLYGTVETYEQDYVGFIQWDKRNASAPTNSMVTLTTVTSPSRWGVSHPSNDAAADDRWSLCATVASSDCTVLTTSTMTTAAS